MGMLFKICALCCFWYCLWLEYEVYCQNKEDAGYKMVHPESFGLEEEEREEYKYHKSDYLLNDFELHERYK